MRNSECEKFASCPNASHVFFVRIYRILSGCIVSCPYVMDRMRAHCILSKCFTISYPPPFADATSSIMQTSEISHPSGRGILGRRTALLDLTIVHSPEEKLSISLLHRSQVTPILISLDVTSGIFGALPVAFNVQRS